MVGTERQATFIDIEKKNSIDKGDSFHRMLYINRKLLISIYGHRRERIAVMDIASDVGGKRVDEEREEFCSSCAESRIAVFAGRGAVNRSIFMRKLVHIKDLLLQRFRCAPLKVVLIDRSRNGRARKWQGKAFY